MHETLPELIVVQLTKKSVTVAVEQLKLELSEAEEGDELLDGSGLSGGLSFVGGGPEALGHSPAMWTPKTLMQGKWNFGN